MWVGPNFTPQCVLDMLFPLQKYRFDQLLDDSVGEATIRIRGIPRQWTWLDQRCDCATVSMRPWKGSSVHFSLLLTFPGWKDAIWADSSEAMCNRLQSLSVPFCEGLVNNPWLGVMGRYLPHLRGHPSLISMTGWYDGGDTIVPTVPLSEIWDSRCHSFRVRGSRVPR
jgi:hypothetical protein